MTEISRDRLVPLETKPQNIGIEISADRLDPLDKEGSDSEWKGIYLKSKHWLKPTAEGLAMGLGGFVGAAGGPIGIAAGGTIGYAAAEQGFDYLDEVFGVTDKKSFGENIKGGLQNIKEGAEYSVGGELFGAGVGALAKGGKAIFKKLSPPIRAKAVKTKAGEELISQGTELTAGQIEKNVGIAKNLEKSIPGLKFTRGQVTNDAQAIALERSLVRGGIRFERGRTTVSGADLNQEQRAFAEKALQDYYEKNLLKGGSLDDFTKPINMQKEGLEKAVKESEDIVDMEVARLSKVMDEQDISPEILKRLKTKEQAVKLKAKEYYDDVPNIDLPTDDLQAALEEIVRLEDKIIETRAKQMIRLVKGITTKATKEGRVAKNTGYQALRRLKSRIGKKARAAGSGASPDLEDARQLWMVSDAVDDAMKQMKYSNPEAKAAYDKATKFYKDEYIPKFRQGTVADVLQKGTRGEETKIALSNIASKFFTKDGIKDFYKAVGDDAVASESMKEFARFDLFNKTYNPSTGKIDTTKAAGWFQKNLKVLDKIGIRKEIATSIRTGKQLDIDQKALEVFNKSMSAKVLNAGPDQAVKQAFSSSKNYGETAKELMTLAKGDKAAEEGIKKAVSEHIFESSKVTAEAFFNESKVSVAKLTNTLKKFEPALKELYKKEPQKLKAIKDVHKSYQVLNRATASPIGGGSDTAENISHIMAAATGARAGRYYLIINIKKAISRYSDNQINKYLLRATFDPDYATNLMSLARANTYKNVDPSKIKRFDFLMRKLVPMAKRKLIEGE